MFETSESDKQTEKLAELEAKKKKLELEAKKIKSSISKKKNTSATKRHVLLGKLLISKVEKGEWSKENLLSELNTFLTKDSDRKLFGLESKVSSSD